MSWIRVCATIDCLPGEYKVVFDGDTAIAVYNIDGQFYAIEDVCTHDGGELAGGPVDGFSVECIRHGAKFDLRTGAGLMCSGLYADGGFSGESGRWRRVYA